MVIGHCSQLIKRQCVFIIRDIIKRSYLIDPHLFTFMLSFLLTTIQNKLRPMAVFLTKALQAGFTELYLAS